MVECVVEFDYEGQEDDELTIKVGDILTDVVKLPGGWWEGVSKGKKGVFPDNFVKEIKKDKVKEVAKEPAAPSKKQLGGNVAELANKLNIQMGPAPKAMKRAEDQSNEKKKVRAKVTYSYSPQNEDEVKLVEGDIVEILQQEEEGWWQGIARGHKGVFPSNFVELIKEDEKSAASSADEAETPTEGELHEIRGKRIRGVGFGNIFGEGGPKLRKAEPHKETTPEPPKAITDHKPKKTPLPLLPKDPPPAATAVDHSVKAPTLPPKHDTKPLERAKVLFSYTAENEDELTVHEGNIINIIDKHLEDGGWWKGELNGRVGVFPDNFVELLPPIDDAPRPRKPPPPSIPPNNSSKQSHRAPPPEPRVEKKVEAKADERQQPPKAVFNKRSPPAPPVSKKPSAAGNPSESDSITDDQKVKEASPADDLAAVSSSSSAPLETPQIETLESSSHKLSHPTANRAKVPCQRRPPSSVKDLPQLKNFPETKTETDDDSESKEEVDEVKRDAPSLEAPERRKSRPKTLMQPQPPMPVMKERMAAELPAAAVRAPPPPRPLSSPPAEVAMREVDVPKKAARPPPPITTPIREKPAKSPVPEEPSPPHASLNSSSGSSFNAPGAPGPEVDQLKREIEQLKTNMVPKAQYDELLTEVKTLTEQMGNLKSLFQKRMLDLMNEVDEEKKVRLNMQVEIDRIKKLTLASNS